MDRRGRNKFPVKLIRTNITIPEHMRLDAERLGLNVSEIARHALAKAIAEAEKREIEEIAIVENALDALGL